MWLLTLVAICATGGVVAQESVLTEADQVRRLSPAEAESHIPVHLEGVVTFWDETLFSRFLQDSTAGIYLRESTNAPSLKPGDLIEITGRTSQGEYAPIVAPDTLRIIGSTNLPAPESADFGVLASGSKDSQFVEVAGVVRGVRFDEASQHHMVTLATGGGRLTVYARSIPVPGEALVDARVRVRGVCSTLFNRQRQLFAIRLMVPRPEDLIIETPAVADPFSAPARTIGSLLQFSPEGTYGHRVKIEGTVVLQHPGSLLFIQDSGSGLKIETTQTNLLHIGDRVEVLGFPGQGSYTPVLEDAVYRVVDRVSAPAPAEIDGDSALSGSYDSRLVRLTATLLDRSRQSREQSLVLQSGKVIFRAHLAVQDEKNVFGGLRNESRVSITGVCVIDPGEWQAGEQWRARSFGLLLRSPKDLIVLKEPPWWTLTRMLWAVALLLVTVCLAFAWVGVLRRKVQQQTATIREQMLAESASKERYRDLFENATDMVLTHDLAGNITSINRAGEKLLQRSREQILNKNLLSLLPEEDRATARDWLLRVQKEAELQTAEWLFINGSGQKLKVEISGRLVEQSGKTPEIESIARDITERRRLERELLEISNREQRRIGHDLHDGVCQQLAGIAYRVDVLGDLLQEAKRPEAAEADKIAALIGEATVQARSVARGLFPVRLEENGLVAALDELADGASSRFPVECTFECIPPAPSIIDNDKALHLYYIAQEALMNAVKHGRASKVRIVMKPSGDRHSLVITDNGIGFQTSQTSGTGMGIRIMHYRAQVIGASLEVRSAAGQGAEVSCHFVPAPPDQ